MMNEFQTAANRAALSLKDGEVEELNEQLMEERKRSRDLQWAVEKEKCRTERDEENKREEVEVGGPEDSLSSSRRGNVLI